VLAYQTIAELLDERCEVIWKRKPSVLARQALSEVAGVSISGAAGRSLPLRHQRLLNSHDTIEVDDQVVVSEGWDDCVPWMNSASGRSQVCLVNFDERADSDEGTLCAGAYDVTGLGHDRKASDLLFGQALSLSGRVTTRLRERETRVDPMSEPMIAMQHAITLPPQGKGCVDGVGLCAPINGRHDTSRSWHCDTPRCQCVFSHAWHRRAPKAEGVPDPGCAALPTNVPGWLATRTHAKQGHHAFVFAPSQQLNRRFTVAIAEEQWKVVAGTTAIDLAHGFDHATKVSLMALGHRSPTCPEEKLLAVRVE
jgi:hypothetical protein